VGDHPTQAFTEGSDKPSFNKVVQVPTRIQWEDNIDRSSEENLGITDEITCWRAASSGLYYVNGSNKRCCAGSYTKCNRKAVKPGNREKGKSNYRTNCLVTKAPFVNYSENRKVETC
jgi:hypothetical protein